jgi:NodT family efflux transporter outer membrane factor (OMF) lipoprotein
VNTKAPPFAGVKAGLRRAALLAGALALAGCTTLGPDFAAPEAGIDKDWRSPSLGLVTTGPADGAWWLQFHDPALDALVTAAVAGNNSLKVAGLRVLEARAQLAGVQAARSPQAFVGTAAAGYGGSAKGNLPIARNDFLYGSVGVSAGWEIDFWGRFRRGIESADAAYFASIANYEDFAIILRSEVARLYLSERTLEERLAVLKSNMALQERSVEITERLFREGAESELDVQQARTQLLSTQAAIPELEAGIIQTRNGLTLLLGRAPGDLPELALSPPQLPVLPAVIAADIPADLLRRRPDVRAAALRAGAQSAQIGLARAELYPSLSLVGSLGVTRTSLGGLSNSVDFGIGPSLRWNFLDLGRIRNNVRVQDARFQQTLAAYRDTVLQAATEVDSSAIALVKNREENDILAQSQAAAKRSLDLATLRYREGLQDFQRVLDAQAALLRQQDRYISNRGQVATDMVALHKALGGGLIGATEADFADAATRAAMAARTDWGKLLAPPAQPTGKQP